MAEQLAQLVSQRDQTGGAPYQGGRMPAELLGAYDDAWRRFRHDRVAMVAASILGCIVLVSLMAPLIAAHVLQTAPDQMTRTPDGRLAILQPPGPGYPLGTDALGRDNLTRLLYAGQVSLAIGFMVALISVLLGTAAGLAAGYFGGWVDDLISMAVQFFLNLPGLVVLIALSVMLRPDVLMLALIFGLFFWPRSARQVRGVVLSLRSREFVEAARAVGASDLRIMLRHLLPNVSSTILVVAGLDVAAAILGESALSFLGFGVQVPVSSWGNMLSGSQDLFHRAPWLVYPPGAMIFLTVLCVVLVADGLRDAFDPRI